MLLLNFISVFLLLILLIPVLFLLTYIIRKNPRPCLLNILGFVALVTIISIFIAKGLKSYTNHGEYISVPDFSGLMYDEIEDFARQRSLVPLIIDSIYDNSRMKGSVIGQDPPPEQLVKRKRKIYLTIVSMSSEMIRMPDLSDLTLRQAIATLEVYGLKAGRLRYVPHIALNAVLAQEYKGKDIEPGTLIEKGSTINLVLGQGLRNERTQVPFLIGKTREEAMAILQLAALNVGAEIFQSGSNEAKAYVVKQNPVFSNSAFVPYGASIDLWYKPDLDFDVNIIQQLLLQEVEMEQGNEIE